MSKISFHRMLSIIEEFSKRFSINILLGFLHRDKGTYYWPWKNSGRLMKILKELKLWPCDLFIVIAKANTIGNCFLKSVNGNEEESPIFNVIRGIETSFTRNRRDRRTVVENLDLAGHYKVFHQKFRKFRILGFFTHALRKWHVLFV